MNDVIIKDRERLEQIVAGDGCFLTELFHPDRDAAALRYSLAYAYVEAQGCTLDHVLEQTEVYYIIRGTGIMHLNGKAYAIKAGSCYYVPAQCRQWLENQGTERLEFLVIVDPPWTAQGETVNTA